MPVRASDFARLRDCVWHQWGLWPLSLEELIVSTPLISGFELEVQTTRRLCAIINTTRAKEIDSFLAEGNYLGYLGLSPDYTIEDHGDFADDYLLVSVLKKSQLMPFQQVAGGASSAAEVAKQKFYSAEMLCKETNEKLSSVRYARGLVCKPGSPVSLDGNTSRWYPMSAWDEPEWLARARGIIADILGPLKGVVDGPKGPIRPLDEITRLMRHGPGSTTGVVGDGLVASQKYDSKVDLTEELLPYAEAIMGPNWSSYRTAERGLRVVAGNEFFSVPKDATTERGACKGPTLNVFGQLGIGRYMSKRLRLFGCDLQYGHERQRKLARSAQADGRATIDWSQASDLWAYMAVLLLLPQDWFRLLDMFREKRTLIDGVWVELQKFSAMGNGYTFPLESLLFLGVVRAIVPRCLWDECGVFGDDIICPQTYAPLVIQALEFLGSKVNHKKTFLAGRFFESCGTDWHDGRNVRPFYLAQESTASIPYSVQIANALRLYASRRGGGPCDSRFRELWEWLVSQVPLPWSDCLVPESFGDVGVIVTRDEARPGKAQCEPLSPLPEWKTRVTDVPWLPGAFTKAEIQLSREMRKSTGFNGWIEGFSCKHVVMATVNVDRRTYGVLLAQIAAGEEVRDDRSDLLALYGIDTDIYDARRFSSALTSWADRLSIEASATRGLEPRRGYLGRITTKTSVAPQWTNELDWV